MNLWNIKNRWLRAAVAWLAAPPLTVLAVICLVVAIAWGILISTARDMRDETGDAYDQLRDWPWHSLWLAMTGREP